MFMDLSLTTSSYFLSASSAINLACDNWASKIATLSSSMLVRFSRAFRILYFWCFFFVLVSFCLFGGQAQKKKRKLIENWIEFFLHWVQEIRCHLRSVYLHFLYWFQDSKFVCGSIKSKKATEWAGTYRSLSSAAWDASESLAVAEPKRSSERSRSSSKSWIRRLRAATSDSA